MYVAIAIYLKHKLNNILSYNEYKWLGYLCTNTYKKLMFVYSKKQNKTH